MPQFLHVLARSERELLCSKQDQFNKIYTVLWRQKQSVKLGTFGGWLRWLQGSKNRTKLRRNILFVSGVQGDWTALALKHMALWLTVSQYAFWMFYGSCHCLNRTSVPHLALFSWVHSIESTFFHGNLAVINRALKFQFQKENMLQWSSFFYVGMYSDGNNFCRFLNFWFKLSFCLCSLYHLMINILLLQFH